MEEQNQIYNNFKISPSGAKKLIKAEKIDVVGFHNDLQRPSIWGVQP